MERYYVEKKGIESKTEGKRLRKMEVGGSREINWIESGKWKKKGSGDKE
jgi:hypothetical protein